MKDWEHPTVFFALQAFSVVINKCEVYTMGDGGSGWWASVILTSKLDSLCIIAIVVEKHLDVLVLVCFCVVSLERFVLVGISRKHEDFVRDMAEIGRNRPK